MKRILSIQSVLLLLGAWAHAVDPAEMQALAKACAADLLLGCYVTVDDTQSLIESAEARAQSLKLLHGMGIHRVYVETFRSGVIPEETGLRTLRDFFTQQGLSVVGGIATYPGSGFGVTSDTGLPWFNFQAPETQSGLESVVRMTARVFNEMIIDDFFCSGDKSAVSDAARGNRGWSEYRRDLLTALSQRMVLGPAREENPNVTVIMKFPQWYDLFHVYGYDLEREPQLYDRVYVGTETRGARTQRYGFTQPYEGFVNYRWIASLSGKKIGGAWFDHGDCDAEDFLDQAYQSVLAGAPELVLFSYGAFTEGHPGHQLLRDHFAELADLAALVRDHPVEGVPAYKPVNSDAGTDLYLMDQLGMLGIPLVPVSRFPAGADTIILPTQAAKDLDVAKKVAAWIGEGRHLTMTAGFLAATRNPDFAAMAGLSAPVESDPLRTKTIRVSETSVLVPAELGLAANLQPTTCQVLLEADSAGTRIPYLTTHTWHGATISVLNCATFSQADFDAVHEVLLSPRKLGMLEVPSEWTAILQDAIGGPWGADFEAPGRVTFQPLAGSKWRMLQNYNLAPVNVTLHGQSLTLPARGHVLVEADK